MGRGGSRMGSGRKSGTGFSATIAKAVAKHVDLMLHELLSDKDVYKKALQSKVDFDGNVGWVYLIKNESEGLYKFGITTRSRLSSRLSLYKSHFMDIDLVFCDLVDNCMELEEKVLGIINPIRGDWFECSHQDIDNVLAIITAHKYPEYARWAQK